MLFSIDSYNKVISSSESRNVNYIVIDNSHNYEEVEKMNYKRKNQYNNLLERANMYIDK